MEIKNLFHRNERSQKGKLITLEQAKKYAQSEKYKDCIFPVEGIIGGKVMCRIQKVQRKEEGLNLNKNEQETSFKKYVTGGGKYRGINGKVKEEKTNTSDTIQYNNCQSAKRYNPEAYTR